jgi:hypothetical protein
MDASPRSQAIATTQANNNKLANLISSNSTGGRRKKRKKSRTRRKYRKKRLRGGTVVVKPLTGTELYNVNSTNAVLTRTSKQSQAKMAYDNVALIQKKEPKMMGPILQYTIYICFIVILLGLGLTLALLSIYKQALPALPISILLGVLIYTTTRSLIIPTMQTVTSKGLYF